MFFKIILLVFLFYIIWVFFGRIVRSGLSRKIYLGQFVFTTYTMGDAAKWAYIRKVGMLTDHANPNHR